MLSKYFFNVFESKDLLEQKYLLDCLSIYT